MILVAGGTGFIGRSVVRQLVEMGKPVRLLIRPSKRSPNIVKGADVEVAVTSMHDGRSLRAAFKDVDIVFDLITDARRGGKADFLGVDVQSTRALTQAAKQANVKRYIYLSHLGADQGSAFAMLQAKALSETTIYQSSVPYTILRTGVVFGPGDLFTTSLARLIKISPGFVLVPGDGTILLQPIWVEDLVTCMTWALDHPNTLNQTFQVGGSEYLSFNEILGTIMSVTGRKRAMVHLSPVYIRILTLVLEQFIPRYPISIHWLDYLGSDRTCSLDTLPRSFGILPARFSKYLDYLKGS